MPVDSENAFNIYDIQYYERQLEIIEHLTEGDY
jgi:hypothetical protein